MSFHKTEQYIMTACIGLLLIMFFNSLLSALNTYVKKHSIHNTFTDNIFYNTAFFPKEHLKDINIDWKKLYPFKENKEKSKRINKNKLTLINEKINSRKDGIDKHTNKELIGYVSFVELAKKYNNLIRWHIIPINTQNKDNIVLDAGDDYLIWNYHQQVNKNILDAFISNMIELNEYASKKNISLLYVQSPYKINKYQYSYENKDFTNKNADMFIAGLEENDIAYFDIRNQIKDINIDYNSLFFRTDHHWKPETGLWVSKILSKYLNKQYKFAIDTTLLDEDNFRYVQYKKWFLGSLGKRATLVNTVPDDISLIYPKYDTYFEYTIPTLNLHSKGDFSITYDMNEIEDKDFYNRNPYGAYNHGDRAEIVIKNLMTTNNKKVLFIKDSFVNTVAPFIALGVKQVNIIDLRLFNGSIKKYIDKENPDIIIIMYSCDAFTSPISEKYFAFH